MIVVLFVAGIIGGGAAAVNWRINLFGLYGDVRGQSRAVVYNERQSKYLYSFNYIPANFDALLVGSSIAGNLEMSAMSHVRMYNAAINGGNMTEEKLVAANALRNGQFRLVVLFINPYLVMSHGRKGGGMEERDRWSGLGSTELLMSYIGVAALRLGLEDQKNALGQCVRALGFVQGKFKEAGTYNFDELEKAAEPWDSRPASEAPAPPSRGFQIDDVALRELSELAELARVRGSKLVWVMAPAYAVKYLDRRADYAIFEKKIRDRIAPDERVIDFNDGSFSSLTGNPGNFYDGYHLTRAAAGKVAGIIDSAIGAMKL